MKLCLVTFWRNSELNSFIKELPEGADTVLNENGKNVSGGQRQRIAVARAFIKQAPYYCWMSRRHLSMIIPRR